MSSHTQKGDSGALHYENIVSVITQFLSSSDMGA